MKQGIQVCVIISESQILNFELLKFLFQGCAMPTEILGRGFVALKCLQLLHLAKELDDILQSVNRESFLMREEEQLSSITEKME